MGVRLFLIRHGQTESNAEGRYQGSIDSVLTNDGIAQARAAKKYLSNVGFNSVYASPMKRTMETARIISGDMNHEIKVMHGLKELDFGKWEGLKFEEINSRYKEDYQAWLTDPYNNPPTDGESFAALIKRAKKDIESIVSENPDGSSAAVITHGGVILSLIVDWLQIPPQCWRSLIQRQGAINIVVIDKGFPYISSINYTGHISPIYDDREDKVIELYSKVKDKK